MTFSTDATEFNGFFPFNPLNPLRLFSREPVIEGER